MNVFICRLLRSSRKPSSWPSSSRVEPHRSRQPLARHRLQLLLRPRLRSLRLQLCRELPLWPTQPSWWELKPHTTYRSDGQELFFVQWSWVKRRVQTEIVNTYHSLSEEIQNPVGVWTLSSMSFPGKSILMAVHMSQREGCAYHIVHAVMVDVSGFYGTVLDSGIRGSTRCELAGPNSLQTCCVSGIRLLQSPWDLCVCVSHWQQSLQICGFVCGICHLLHKSCVSDLCVWHCGFTATF